MFLLVVERLYERTHDYANLANRASPIVKDLMLASNEVGLRPKGLYKTKMSTKRKKRRRGTLHRTV
jgi:transcription initiation factor TFIID subunit 8